MTLSNQSLPYAARQTRLVTTLDVFDLDALALNAGPSLTYLTGLNFHLSERPAVAIFVPGEPVTLVIPEFEAGKTTSLPFPAQIYTYSEDPATWAGAFQAACKFADLNSRKVGVEPRRFRVLELRLMEAGCSNTSFLSAEEMVASIRMYKDETEVAAMQQAVHVAQDALRALLPLIKTGMTERELASELTAQVLRHGSDAELPLRSIVASGPNSANPHAFPTDRQIIPGDLLTLDWGASVGGYFSDLTPPSP
jgi:Xaa-Pro dipeptidase